MRVATTDFLLGDVREALRAKPDGHYHAAITSPPYWALRDYGRTDGLKGVQIGREKTPAEYVANLVAVFREVKRVLRDDGILFVNLGDTYASSSPGRNRNGENPGFARPCREGVASEGEPGGVNGYQSKELIGVPWQFAFAMRADGWLLRQEIIWAKRIAFGDRHAEQVRERVIREAKAMGLSDHSAARLAAVIEPQIGACMPQSVTDRCSTSHEHVFMFTKRPDYFADMEAVKEEGKNGLPRNISDATKSVQADAGINTVDSYRAMNYGEKGRNLSTVWTINPEPYGGDHFAAYPTRLVAPMVKMATSERGCCPTCGAPVERVVEREKLTRVRPNKLTKRDGEDGTGNYCANDVDGVATRTKGWRPTCECPGLTKDQCVPCRVLDPFGGTGTTAVVANALGVDATIVDLFPEYLEQAKKRVAESRWNPPGTKKKSKLDPKVHPGLFEAIP